jgi:ribonuclease PH
MRPSGRATDQLRDVVIEPGANKWAEGSSLIRVGNTHVLCTATVEEKVPPFLKNSGKGWVTAEYGMLPRSTHSRSRRDAKDGQSGRTHEIQRLIGRSLRAGVDLVGLGERQIIIDCDVLQADGGTRCAAITGGWVALAIAVKQLVARGALARSPLDQPVSAVSCGLYAGQYVADLDYAEDSAATVDGNFVVTGDRLIEVQASAEGGTYRREDLDRMLGLALTATAQLAALQRAAVG